MDPFAKNHSIRSEQSYVQFTIMSLRRSLFETGPAQINLCQPFQCVFLNLIFATKAFRSLNNCYYIEIGMTEMMLNPGNKTITRKNNEMAHDVL